ncbi:MAG: hypothetical protein AAGB19_00900 [Cyanobacteria bacterium P01_F01_bin.3]
MRTQNLLVAIGLISLLGGCVTPSTPPPADSGSTTGNPSKTTSQSLSSETSSAASCELTESQPESLGNAENTPVFEQFNFRPIELSAGGGSITVTTAHHIFSLCESNGEWSITSTETAEDEEPFDYEQSLANIADPGYETVEINGETFEYRIRLQAEWLTEQLKPDTIDPEAIASEDEEAIATATEDAVFFELTTPDGELISEQLYTISELQDAGLGASLGVPSIADVVATDTELWFAATASQGEGDSGFASLIRYDAATKDITAEQPDELQGDQLTSLVITGNEANDSEVPLTLWMGTQRSGEGNPYFPTSGLVAYQPDSQLITNYTVANSPLVGAIPHRLAVEGEHLWVGTGNGICQVNWQIIDTADSWACWRFTATAELPSEGVDLYQSFSAEEPAALITDETVEVLWASQSFEESYNTAESATEEASSIRYEVVYEPGFEAQLSQGGYRVPNEVAQRAAGGNEIFWPGNQWHWAGDRFKRTLDEVSLNLVGGGPRGLVTANSQRGFDLDNHAVRGDFDLLELTDENTKVRYYSGWIEGDEVDVYPAVVPAEALAQTKENPLPEIATKLSATQGP